MDDHLYLQTPADPPADPAAAPAYALSTQDVQYALQNHRPNSVASACLNASSETVLVEWLGDVQRVLHLPWNSQSQTGS